MAFLAVMLVTVLSVEGLLSLTTGRSLLRQAPRVFEADFGFDRIASAPPTAVELERAARENPGPYWLHPDPRVGIALRPSSELTLARAPVHTGGMGLRSTPAPPVSEASGSEVVRVAVVGASIPFGLGVADGETIAARLQELFAHVPVRGATVAVPLWSYRNALHFLLDHWDQLRPDVVLYMPFFNDLGDTPVVDAAGFRADWPDAMGPRPWPPVDRRKDLIWKRLAFAIRNGSLPLHEDDLGSIAIEADLSPASSRRYDENATGLARLARHCRQRGAKLAILAYREHPHTWHLISRLQHLLRESGEEVPIVPFFRALHRRFKLGWDPHPNAETQRVMALWTARKLVELGWLPPPPDPSEPAWQRAPRLYRGHRSRPFTPEEIRSRSDESRLEALAITTAEIDFESGRGMKQVIAGLTWEGTATTGLLALLRRGHELELTLEPLDGGFGGGDLQAA
ncbi:MAG: hypothetical protein MI919_14970, partial [Holophagales bacterium]|nr:hypothetical protein [Holophagales bacterium]